MLSIFNPGGEYQIQMDLNIKKHFGIIGKMYEFGKKLGSFKTRKNGANPRPVITWVNNKPISILRPKHLIYFSPKN